LVDGWWEQLPSKPKTSKQQTVANHGPVQKSKDRRAQKQKDSRTYGDALQAMTTTKLPRVEQTERLDDKPTNRPLTTSDWEPTS
jgi:hypothetical protein